MTRHGATVARLAVVLLRQRRLTGPELDRLLAPVTADPEPFARLISLAGRIAADPAMTWPPDPALASPSAGPFRGVAHAAGEGTPAS